MEVDADEEKPTLEESERQMQLDYSQLPLPATSNAFASQFGNEAEVCGDKSSTIFSYERHNLGSQARQQQWAAQHFNTDKEAQILNVQKFNEHENSVRRTSNPEFVRQAAIDSGFLIPTNKGTYAYNQSLLDSCNIQQSDGCSSKPFSMVMNQREISDLTTRPVVHLNDRRLLTNYEEKHFKDSQNYYQSTIAAQPVPAVQGRNSFLHHVPLLEACESCAARSVLDTQDLPQTDTSSMPIYSVRLQPRGDGSLVVNPLKSRLVSFSEKYGYTVMGTKILPFETIAKVGTLVITTTARKGLLTTFSAGNLSYQLLQTDGQLLCVPYKEVLAVINSATYDAPLQDRAGEDLHVGDAVSFTRFGQRFGKVAEILDGCVYVEIDFAMYGTKLVCLHSSSIYRTLASHQKMDRLENRPETPSFTERATRIADLIALYGERNVLLQLCKELTSGILFVQKDTICYCTRLSMDTAFFLETGCSTEQSIPTRHQQQPITVSIPQHLRHGTAKNGSKISRRDFVLRLSDIKKGIEIVCFVEAGYLGWLIIRPHHSFDFRPYQVAFGDELILLEDYFKLVETDRENVQEKLDNQLLAGLCPIDKNAFLAEFKEAGQALKELRRANSAATFADRSKLTVKLFINFLEAAQNGGQYIRGSSRTFVRPAAFEHILQGTGVSHASTNQLFAQRSCLGETSGVNDDKMGDCDGLSNLFLERLSLVAKRDDAEKEMEQNRTRIKDLRHVLDVIEGKEDNIGQKNNGKDLKGEESDAFGVITAVGDNGDDEDSFEIIIDQSTF